MGVVQLLNSELIQLLKAYFITRDEFFPGGDSFGLYDRLVNRGYTPIEHWTKDSDDIVWTGWATYVGFVTPSSITRTKSTLRAANSTTARWFYYRPYINNRAELITMCKVTFQSHAGLMVDDGIDAGDGLGANNFYRIFVRSAGTTSDWMIRTEYRTGGGAVTQSDFYSRMVGEFNWLRLIYGYGTRWTNWGPSAQLVGADGIVGLIEYLGAIGWSWTPVNIGVYGESISNNIDKISTWDWYHEGAV